MTPEQNQGDGKQVTSSDRNPVLILQGVVDRGVRRVAHTLGGIVSAPPHDLDVVEVYLPEDLTGQSVINSLASWTGIRIEAAVIAGRGWPVVEQQLGTRSPAVVLAMDPVAAAAADSWRGKGLFRAPVVGVCCGMRVDPAWARTSVDRLSVADEVQAEGALELGIQAECLVPCGVPVCGGFSSPDPDAKDELRRRFEIPTGRPVALVVTDGLEPGQLTGALFQLSMVAEQATLLFDVAGDDEGADLLRRRARLYDIEARMFGKVEEAGELWAASDIVVSAPHTYIEQRALALNLPMIHLMPTDDATRETARIYVDREIGRLVDHLSTLAVEVELQLRPETLAASRQTMRQISRRSSSGEVARLIAQTAAQAEEILDERYRRTRERAALAAQKDEAPAPPRRGPLEVIGVPGKGLPGDPPEAGTLEDLEAAEAETNRQVTEHQKESEHWSRRAGLAAQKNEGELEATANRMVDKHVAAMHHALAELARLADRRKVLETGTRRGRKLERSFRKMEVEDALAEIKKKIDREK